MNDDIESIWEYYVADNDIGPHDTIDLDKVVALRKSVKDVVGLMSDTDLRALCNMMKVSTEAEVIQQFYKMGIDACVYWLENAFSFYQDDRDSNWGSMAYRHHR